MEQRGTTQVRNADASKLTRDPDGARSGRVTTSSRGLLGDGLFVGRKDLFFMLRAKETLIWVFVMPIVFFYFIGTVTGGFASRGDSQDRLALWTDGDAGFLEDQLVHRLEERDYQIVRPDSEKVFQQWSRRLRIPAAMTDSVLAGRPVTLDFKRRSSGLGNDYDQVRVARAVYTVLADLVVVAEMGSTPTPESFAALNATPRALGLEVTSAGQRKRIPRGYEQSIPGIMVMFVLVVMTTSGAVLLVIERRQGLLRRLAYTPIPRLAVVIGKWGGKTSIGIVQILFAMLAGTLLFSMNWGPDLAFVVLVMFVYAGFTGALGLLLGSVARSEGQAVAIGVISANVLGALGGCWWPIEIAPDWMQKLQLFLPTGWAMDAIHKLVSFGAGPASVIPHIVGMTLGTVVLVMLSARVFRFE
jgi:ABC-type Na+ efflux pump permease subunit